MTEKSEKRRGYNQSKLLAEALSRFTEVPVFYGLIKKSETKRQVTLGRKERLKNLQDSFRVKDKKSVVDKTLVIIDDVTTTGATAEVIAEALKRAGAKTVYLITVASTPPIDKY
jgi:competence protein ComFC